MAEHGDAASGRPAGPARPRRPRWGVRTVSLVLVAFACMWLSDLLYTARAGAWVTVVTLAAWVALLSALYCTYRGLRSASWLPR